MKQYKALTVALVAFSMVCSGCAANDAQREVGRLSRAHAWWHVAYDGLSEWGLKAYPDFAEKDLQGAVQRARAAGQEGKKSLQRIAMTGKENDRCWAIELLGELGDPSSRDVLLNCAKDQKSWKVRCAGIMALGKCRSEANISDTLPLFEGALQDQTKIAIQEDERQIGQGGSAEYYLPVVLAGLKAITLDGRPGLIPVAIQGLRTKPHSSVSYDDTPEPFPDVVSESLPSWYVHGVSKMTKQADVKAGMFLVQGMSQGDLSFQTTSGGKYAIMMHGSALLQKAPSAGGQLPTSYHAFLIHHLDKAVGEENTADILMEAYQEKLIGAQALSAKVNDDRILQLMVEDADDNTLILAVTTSQGNGPLRSDINKGLLLPRLIEMLNNHNDQFIYRIPALLGEIDDPKVVEILLGLLEVKDGGGSLSAEHRSVEALKGLARQGDIAVLRKIESLRYLGDLAIEDNDWIQKEVDGAIATMKGRL